MMREYQIVVNISFGLPVRVLAEDGKEATDKAHEILMSLDDLELLDLIDGAQYQYDAYWDTRKKYTDKETKRTEKMREGQEGKE